jgi:hypothetical protein
MPHAKIGTSACTEIMKKASVAFVDKYRTKAYNLKGFNKGIKLVRLGDGIPITDFYNDPEFALEPQLSPEATAELVIGCDHQKYKDVIIDDENRGYFTENYKDVFIQLAPNKRIADIYVERYGIPEESIYICGSPRSYAVPDRLGDRRRKILMIPADRQDLSEQESFFDELSENLTQIGEFLEQEDKYLTICFFRTFSREFIKRIEGVTDIYERIDVIGWERDIFHDMPGYEAMITDGSELMYDFALQDKPIVIINTKRDADRLKAKLLYDYDDILPGPAASDWKSGLVLLKEAINDPAKDHAFRKKALGTVCDLSVNNEENSERIIQEVKKRLKGLE